MKRHKDRLTSAMSAALQWIRARRWSTLTVAREHSHSVATWGALARRGYVVIDEYKIMATRKGMGHG